jgi:hypothetical protein
LPQPFAQDVLLIPRRAHTQPLAQIDHRQHLSAQIRNPADVFGAPGIGVTGGLATISRVTSQSMAKN